MTPDTTERRADWKANLLERLHDPVQLRVGVMSIVFVLGYAAIYTPLSEQIASMTHKLERNRRLLDLARSMEQLQKQYRTFSDRVPMQSDNNEWMQYVVEGTRQFPRLNLINFGCGDPKRIAPYKAVSLKMELKGTFLDLNKFLVWLESNRRLLRADEIRLVPPRSEAENSETMTMYLIVSGMTG